ncbi:MULTISPECIES: signal peptidase I [Microbacterium]|jgi:signal peptidase I|uniref:signal peptidase I n=1 Tax=Microbacterium TaxID=33882 RepID=UPI000734462C|nr:signal peptidase I [Microbacterium testaceum]KTS02272.1 signal peptidase I [Microbacterium testaceum]KTS55703.1 signal peptidase I [Microbacterium testaceum]
MSDQTASTPDAMASSSPDRRRRGWGAFLRDIVVIILIALVVSFLVKTFVVRSFYIPSASMNNTLIEQDRILVDELTPRFGQYSRGDVVVFRDPGGWLPVNTEPARPPLEEGADWVLSLFGLSAPDSDDHLIKRVIGTPGDHVVCCNALGQTSVNGVPLDEPYVKLAPGATAPNPVPYDITVPPGSLWVLGDNRNSSKDSRFNQDQPGQGFVPIDNVVGRAFLITWPFSRFGLIDFHHNVFAGVPAPEATP